MSTTNEFNKPKDVEVKATPTVTAAPQPTTPAL